VKLYLVRHGVSAGNLPGRLTGWSDQGLTPLGVEQARRVAARLAPLGPMPVYSSDLPRALETAAVILASRSRGDDDAPASPVGGPGGGREITVIADRRLREISLGDYEGRTWDDLAADRALSAAFARSPLTTVLPGGESMAMLRERVLAAFRDIAAGAHGAACLVAHDGPIRSIVNHVLKVPHDRHFALAISHGGLTLLEVGDDWVSVRFVNDTSHLAGLGA